MNIQTSILFTLSYYFADRELQAARKGGSAIGKKLVGGHRTNRSMSIA